MAKEKTKGKFEASLDKLEGIVARLEEEQELDLDEAIALYTQGVRESETCQKELASAEARIKKLVSDGAGGLKEAEFEPEAENGK